MLCLFSLVMTQPLLSAETAEPEQPVWRVVVPVANVRAEPRTSAELVTQLPMGTQVTELAREGNWLQVRISDTQLAWMNQVTLGQSIRLMDVALEQATRTDLREAASRAGLQVIREVDTYPYDLYNPAGWMAGATEMAMGYTLQDQLFAVAEITFRAEQDVELVARVAERIRQDLRLGSWQQVSGRRAEGPVEYSWQQGGLVIKVFRGWPDTTTYVTFEMPQRIALMQQELRQAR